MTARPLTPGEVELAKRVFKDSIDYDKVKIHNEKYVAFQPDESAMTPNGEIYAVGTNTYLKDYSDGRVYDRGFFIHEIAHVWQYQLNILNPITAAIGQYVLNGFDYSRAYAYELKPGKDLLDYSIEQQAQIIEDYYLRWIAKVIPRKKHLQNNAGPAVIMPLYSRVMARFLQNPGYARHVTVCRRERTGPPGSRRRICTRRLAP